MADQEDLPWRDAPGDRILPAEQEPAPADVIGWDDDGAAEPVDVDRPMIPAPSAKYHRDTLEERLAEEEPEVGSSRAPLAAIALLHPERVGEDVTAAEGEEGVEPEELAAEEAAIHISRSGS